MKTPSSDQSKKDLSKVCIHSDETLSLYPGIDLILISLTPDSLISIPERAEHALEINYCRSGSICWKTPSGTLTHLEPGDFGIYSRQSGKIYEKKASEVGYEGFILSVDLQMLSSNPPELLAGSGVTGEFLFQKFCAQGSPSIISETVLSKDLFSAFYDQPEKLQLSYRKLKALEILLELGKLELTCHMTLTECQSDQIEIVRQIHEQLTRHMEQRITIEELSRQYLMNPTTLKSIFKSVYGTSIAAHMKKHRMEYAAELLRDTTLSMAEIAQAVGYDSQSRFSSAFKDCYHVLPREFRKNNSSK